MRHTFRLSASILAGLLMVSLSACGASTSHTRNLESGAVACVSQSTSKLTKEGDLELHFCSAATKWVREDEGATYSDKMRIIAGKAVTSLVAFGSMKVISYDSTDTVIGIDKITLNGSKGGLTYRVNTSLTPPVMYEAARPQWSGTENDPKVTRKQAFSMVTAFNNTSAPVGDWFIGNHEEQWWLMRFSSGASRIRLSSEHEDDNYWTNDTITLEETGEDEELNGMLRPEEDDRDPLFFYGSEFGNSKHRVRPIRTYTVTSGPVILVDAGFVPNVATTSTSVTNAPATSAPQSSVAPSSIVPATSVPVTTVPATMTSTIPETTTSVAMSPEQVTRIQIINPQEPSVNIPAGEQVVTISPIEVKKYIADVSTAEIKTSEIQFDGGDWMPISLTVDTKLVVPAAAHHAVVRITTVSGDKYQIPKTIVHSGESITTATQAPTQQPTIADDVPMESPTSNNGLTVSIVLLVILTLIAIGYGVLRRRARK